MSWVDLLFAHWPVDAGRIRELLPLGLELDLYEGQAWVSVVPFRMAGTRPRGLPAVGPVSDFPELNLRTYVHVPGDTVHERKPGVFFFSLDAASRVAVRLARWGFALPYFDARMSARGDGEAVVYDSYRTHRDAPPAVFRARYRPTGPVFHAEPGSLDHWLAERYCLYAATPLRFGQAVPNEARGLLRGEIHHAPWPLQAAEAEIEEDTLTDWLELERPATPPRLHFARRLDVTAWRPRRVPVVGTPAGTD